MKWILNDLTSLLDQHEDTGTRKGRDEGHRKAWLLIPAMSRRQGGRRYGRRPWRFRRGFRRPGRGVRHWGRWLWRLTSPWRDILWHPVKLNQCEPMRTNLNQFQRKTMAIWFNHVKSWGSAGLIASLPEIWAIWRFLSHRQWLGMSVLSRGQGIQGRSTRCVRFLTARSIFWHLRYLQVNHCR